MGSNLNYSINFASDRSSKRSRAGARAPYKAPAGASDGSPGSNRLQDAACSTLGHENILFFPLSAKCVTDVTDNPARGEGD